MHKRLRAALLITVLLAVGCGDQAREQYATSPSDRGGGDAPAGVTAPKEGYAVSPDRDEVAQAAPGDPNAPPTPAEPPQAGPAMPAATDTAASTQSVAPQMIIRTGTATVRVDSLEPAMARVEQLARSLGGYVANTAIQSGSETLRRATMEVKIPAARWNQAISGLRPIGKLEAQQTSTEDVGEEYVDVTARMTNARRLETRLVELLATRTGRLEDVLAVERELARVREEIERYEGRLRYLAHPRRGEHPHRRAARALAGAVAGAEPDHGRIPRCVAQLRRLHRGADRIAGMADPAAAGDRGSGVGPPPDLPRPQSAEPLVAARKRAGRAAAGTAAAPRTADGSAAVAAAGVDRAAPLRSIAVTTSFPVRIDLNLDGRGTLCLH